MEKEFIPYEQALALKELGFNERCFGYFENAILKPTSYVSDFKNGTNHNVDFDNVFKLITAPLYQQAFRWFREKYKLTFYVEKPYHHNSDWRYVIDVNENEWLEESFKTYEEAELECLKKLIEICKKN